MADAFVGLDKFALVDHVHKADSTVSAGVVHDILLSIPGACFEAQRAVRPASYQPPKLLCCFDAASSNVGSSEHRDPRLATSSREGAASRASPDFPVLYRMPKKDNTANTITTAPTIQTMLFINFLA